MSSKKQASNKSTAAANSKPVAVNKAKVAAPIPVAAPVAAPITVEIKSIKIKQINEATEDASGLQAKSNKWPLIIDPEGNAKTFLRYTNVNFINTSDFGAMQPENLRRSLIGAIRFNRPFGLDLEDRGAAFWDEVEKAFNLIENGLLENIMSKKLLQDSNYLKLVKIEIDGEEYKDFYFNDFSKFKFMIVTSNENMDKSFLNKFTVYKIES